MTVDHKEKAFEAAIEDFLLTNGGYTAGNAAEFDASLALTPTTVVAFLKDTQPDSWSKLASIYGADVETKVIQTIAKNLDQRGTLDVLRKGVPDRGVKLDLAYFKPSSGLNPETLKLYGQNVLTFTRQVHHSPKNPAHSIDLLLSVNGLPVATAELKNPFTGQTVQNAMRQYRSDRYPTDPLLKFKIRCLVHFAVDPDLVYMTTRLKRKDTFFLPFNKGHGTGAGNPLNPNGYKTAYLWEEVWAKDRWLDILARFVHLEVQESTGASGKTRRKETLIFPRYHQLDAVTRLLEATREAGVGKNYLVQHSAGSGKSNSIAWLAHRLSNLHDHQDQKIFSSVIVITDRRVLDKQLQDTIFQFDHKQGVVECVKSEKGAKNEQLAAALRASTPIIITTLQTFPALLEKVGDLSSRMFAIIADEAHSSQTGESAASLKRVLSMGTASDHDQEPDEEDPEDAVLKAIEARGPQMNLSFYAFTATPKKQTLEMFGQSGADGFPAPFHLYSMRQAIEEGFILNVLRHYTTYKVYYELTKAIEGDPVVDTSKARSAIARFVSLHPHNLAQKTEVMVEHFRQFTRQKIGGKAKAMVVTRSRLHAVRYKREFDRYFKEKGYQDLKALVAFSGTVVDEGADYTESSMNGFSESQVPDKFGSDEYQILLVAEKYQTGFDQPLLHTMYVDKRLKGLYAVQTLSRLNRTCRGKEDTFVLDFENDAEDIKEAFRPYYEQTEIDEPTDPNQLYTLKLKLDEFQYYWKQEVDDFAKVYFKAKAQQNPQDQGLLHKYIDPAVERFKAEPNEERREEFRHLLLTYIRLYGFVSQMVNFWDTDLEKLYAFARLLLSKLPRQDIGGALRLDDEVALTHYRMERTFKGDGGIQEGEGTPLTGPSDVGTGQTRDEDKSPLSQIIQTMNDRFGTDFRPEDRLLFDQVVEDLVQDEMLTTQARSNNLDQFKYAFDPKAIEAFVERMGRNEGIASQLMSNQELREVALDFMMREVYSRAQAAE